MNLDVINQQTTRTPHVKQKGWHERHDMQVGNGKIVRVSGIQKQGRTATILLRGSNKLVLEEADRQALLSRWTEPVSDARSTNHC